MNTKRSGEVGLGEYFGLMIFLIIGLATVGVINGFAQTASTNAFASDPNTATIYGLIPLFLAIVFLAVIGGVAYAAVQKFRNQ